MSKKGFHTSLNIKLLINLLGLIVAIEGIFMLLPLIVSIYYKEPIKISILLSVLITFSSGALVYFLTKNNLRKDFTRRESFLLVSFAWLLISLFGVLPFLLSEKLNFTDAFFETVSGFTTTGASILTDIESMPKSLLFWRSETHWIGGMGIIVLFVALFPFLKTSRISLFNAEASVVVESKVFPKLLDISRSIWLVYVGLTVIETIFLMFGGMDLYDSLCHTFGTVATGGFSTKNDSIASFSPYIQYVITFFMILAGINFSLYLVLIKRKFSKFFSNEELKTYIAVTFIATIVIFSVLIFSKQYTNFEHAFRDSLFQTVSILTTTGYATADYLTWHHAAIAIIVLMMFIGASAGSTTGNIKIIRHVLLIKNLRAFFKRMIHPEVVSVVRYNKILIPPETANNALVFILAYIAITVVSVIIITFTGIDLETSIGAVVASIGCIGPGVGNVGPTGNYAGFHAFGKYFLSFLMVLGRLEIFTVIILFTRSFWKG